MVSDIHRRGTSPVKESCFFHGFEPLGPWTGNPIWTHDTLRNNRGMNTASKEKPLKDDLGKRILGETTVQDQMHSTCKQNSIFQWIGLVGKIETGNRRFPMKDGWFLYFFPQTNPLIFSKLQFTGICRSPSGGIEKGFLWWLVSAEKCQSMGKS